jgi:hypothetical protein
MIVRRSKFDKFVIRPVKYCPGDLGGLSEIVQRFPDTCENIGGFDVMTLAHRPYTFIVSSGSRPAGLLVRFSLAFGIPPMVKPFQCFSVAYDVKRRYHIIDRIGKRTHLSFVAEINDHLARPIFRLVLPCDAEPMHVSWAAAYICNSVFKLSANPSTEVYGNGKIMFELLENLQSLLDGYAKAESGRQYRYRWNAQGGLTGVNEFHNILYDLGSVILYKNVDLYQQDPQNRYYPGFLMMYPEAL